jgi:cytochrome c oxidase subunit 2
MLRGYPRNSCRGSSAVAVTLAVFLAVFTLLTVYYFVVRLWWFPEPITAIGAEIDRQFNRTLWITGLVFVASQLGLAWAVWRFRNRGQRAHYSHGSNKLEVLWTTATIVLFLGLGVWGQFIWAKINFQPPAADALRVEVLGQQFAWNFRYPGPDGVFGRTAPEHVSDARLNFFGLDPADPAGEDDLVLPTLAVPVGRPVELLLRGKDVTHSFFVRELRLKQDAVPGMTIPLRFTVLKTGDYEIICTELCGMGHHTMRTMLRVLEPAEFEQWLAEQAEF